MHINAVNAAYNTNNKYKTYQNFCGLIKDKSVLPVIKKMPKADIGKFKKIQKRLSKTKFWDLKISSSGNIFNEFKFEFIDKKKKSGIITDGIYPYDKVGNMIKVYSIIYGPQNISQNTVKTLQFKSEKRADKLYTEYLQNLEEIRNKGFNLTLLESLKAKVIELKLLEEASRYSEIKDKASYVNTEEITKDYVGNQIKK